MSQEFRYSLTRICLRTGQLSLSKGMAEIFPDSGSVVVVDSLDGREMELTAVAPRRLAGIDEFFERHRLQVNDSIQIRKNDGRITLTALPRKRRHHEARSATSDLLDDIFSQAPLSEAEIRELHPGLANDFPLHRALQEDPRFRLRGGRWHGVNTAGVNTAGVTTAGVSTAGVSDTASASEPEAEGQRGPAVDNVQQGGSAAKPRASRDRESVIDNAQQAGSTAEPGADGEREAIVDNVQQTASAAEPRAEEEREPAVDNLGQVGPAEDIADDFDFDLPDTFGPLGFEDPDGGEVQAGDFVGPAESESADASVTAEPALSSDVTGERHHRGASEVEPAAGEQVESRFPSPVESGREPQRPQGRRDRARERERRAEERGGGEGRRAPVTPYPRGVMFPGEGALNSKRPAADLQSVNRAREALSSFGYTVEGLPHGMLLARAELGRRQHSVLIRVLGSGERLDWAALLARRREQTSDYLAVFGDHRDLHRLTAPAELARATLWSWEGIARVGSLAASIRIGPYDLEPHFEKGGMFGPGLHKFERSVGRYVTERGVFSAVLTRLAALRAPSVFVLDDLVEGELSRDQVADVLATLGGAPFHLVARIDKGEYCLRHRVDEGLRQLSDYALSLGARLPRSRRERLAGLVAPETEEEQAEDVTA